MKKKDMLHMSALALLLLLPAGWLQAAEKQDFGPETMNLKERFEIEGSREPVVFDHRMHQNKLDKECINCHVDEKGGSDLKFELNRKTGLSNDFHKNFCWPCHEQKGVKVGKSCSKCHKK